MAEPQAPCGFLVLDKPAGISSAKALYAIKRRLPRGTKIGHAGTLDPFATGVLVVLVGKATKQCERIMGMPKGYEASLRLGATTATLDPESPEKPSQVIAVPSPGDIERAIAQFRGEISQVPPAFSSLKLGGRRAYDLARRGEQVALSPRCVRVGRLEIAGYEWPELRLVIECGRGFYVRSLARDVGAALGSGAYLTALRRTFVGPFTQDMAVSADGELPLLPPDWLEQHAKVGGRRGVL